MESTTIDPEDCLMPHGDLILVLGHQKRKVLVHSVFLRMKSPRFADMFEPDQEYGQKLRLASGRPIKMLLPDDDPGGFILMYKALCQNYQDITHPDPQDVLKCSILAIKYRFVPELDTIASFWIHNLLHRARGDPSSAWALTQAAYRFEGKNLFNYLTSYIIEMRINVADLCPDSILQRGGLESDLFRTIPLLIVFSFPELTRPQWRSSKRSSYLSRALRKYDGREFGYSASSMLSLWAKRNSM